MTGKSLQIGADAGGMSFDVAARAGENPLIRIIINS